MTRFWLQRWWEKLFGARRRTKKRPVVTRPIHQRRLQVELLEERETPATLITILDSGVGTLDGFLSASDGTITASDNAGNPGTVSRAALQAVNAGVNISITAENGITFNSLTSPLALQATAGNSVSFIAQNGNISFTTQGNTVSTNGAAVNVSATGNLKLGGFTTSNGAITLTGDNMDLGANLNAGTAKVTLTPNTAGQLIDLGGADAAGTLGLTNAELSRITAGVVKVGNSTAGDVNFSTSITQPAGFNTLSLQTNGGVTQTAATSIVMAKLAVQATNAISLTNAGNDVDSLAAKTTAAGQSIDFTDTDGLTVDTVDGLAGISEDLTVPGTRIQLTAGSNVNQTAGADISTRNLLLLGAGSYALNNPGNGMIFLAANLTGAGSSLSYVDKDDLTVGSILGTGGSTKGITTNGGDVTLATVNGNVTVQDTAAGADIITNGGKVSLTAGGNGNSLTLNANAGITSTNAAITLTADDMSLGAAVNSGTATTTLRTNTASRQIDLGTDTAGKLGLTDAEIDNVTASSVIIGRNDSPNASGDITFTAAITPAGTSKLELVTSGQIIDSNGGLDITVTRLALTAGTGIGVSAPNFEIDTTVSNLEATTNSGGINIFNTGSALTIGGVTPALSGVTAGGGNIQIVNDDNITIGATSNEGISNTGGGNINVSNSSGDVTVNAPVAVTGGSGTVSLSAEDNLNINQPVSTIGGSITVESDNNNDNVGDLTSTVLGSLTTQGGAITVRASNNSTATNDITLAGAVTVNGGGGSVSIVAGDNVTINTAVSVTGTGTIAATADNNSDDIGTLTSTSSITTASGNILLQGGFNTNIGGTVTAKSTGNITIHADFTNGGLGDALIAGAVSTDDGNVTVIGQDIDIAGTIKTDSANTVAGKNTRVTLANQNGNDLITLGADTINALGLTNADLNNITTPLLKIGGNNGSGIGNFNQAGNFSLVAPISLNPAKVPVLSLETTGAIVDSLPGEGTLLTVQSLALRTGTGAGTADDIDVNISNFAARNTTSGDINIDNAGTTTLTISSVDGVSGVVQDANNGDINITTVGPLDIDDQVISDGGGDSDISLTTTGPNANITKTFNTVVQSQAGDGDVVLGANGAGSSIIISSEGSSPDVRASGAGNISLLANDAVTLNDGSPGVWIQAANGNINIQSNVNDAPGTADVTLGTNSLVETEGNVFINADPDANGIGGGILMKSGSVINGSSTPAAQNVSLTAAKDITLTQINADNDINVTITGNLGNIVDDKVDSTVLVAGNNINLTSGGRIGGQNVLTTSDVESADTGSPSSNYLDLVDVNYGNQISFAQIGGLGNIQVRRVGGGVNTSDIVGEAGTLVGSGNQFAVVSTGGNFTVNDNFNFNGANNANLFFATADEQSANDVGNSVVINAAKSLTNTGSSATTTLMASGGVSSTITGPAADNTADVTVTNLQLVTTGGQIGISAAQPLEINAVTLGGFSNGKVNNVTQTGGNWWVTDTLNGVALGQINAGLGNSGTNSNVVLKSLGNVTPGGPNITAVTPNDNVPEIIGNVITIDTSAATSTGTGGQIGTPANFVEVDSNLLNASTNNSNFWISEVGAGGRAGTQIGLVTAGTTSGTTTGFLRVRNGGSITSEGSDVGTADVVAPTINLSTVAGDTPAGGNFGTSLASPLEINATTLNSNLAGGGNLFVDDTGGGLTVQKANTTLGNIGIEASGNSLLTIGNGSSSGNAVQAFGPGNTAVLKANNIDITATGLVSGPRVIIVPDDGTITSIDLGGADSATTLGLTEAELDKISATVLQIGGDPLVIATKTGVPIAISGAIDFTTGGVVPTLDLSTAGAITETGSLKVANLALRTGGTATLNGNNDADVLAADVNGNLVFKDTDDLSLDTVDGLSNITVPGANFVELNAGATTQTGNGIITGGSLALLGAGPFTLTQTTNNVGTLAGNVTGAVTYTDADALAIGSVNGTNGLTTAGAANTVSTVAGDLSVNQNVAAGAAPVSLTAGGLNSLLTNSAAITGNAATLAADKMSLAAGTVNVGAGIATVKPSTANRVVNIDNTAGDPNGELRLSQAELNTITAGTLRVGSSTAGNLTLKNSLTSTPATLSLISGGVIGQSAAANIITATNLSLQGAGGVNIQGDNQVQKLSGNTSGGNNFSFSDKLDLTIGTVDGVAGITGAGGTVDVTVKKPGVGPGVLTVNSAISNPNGTIQLTANNLGINADLSALGANGRVLLLPFDNTITQINLGGADSATTLGLTDAELDHAKTSLLRIGSTGITAPIVVSSNITADANYTLLSLKTGGNLSETGGSRVSGTNFSFETGSLTGTQSVPFQIGETLVAGKVNTGSIFLFSNIPSSISATPLDGVTGLTAGPGGTTSLTTYQATANAYAEVTNAYNAYVYAYNVYAANPTSSYAYFAYINAFYGFNYAQVSLNYALLGNGPQAIYWAKVAAYYLNQAAGYSIAEYNATGNVNAYYAYIFAARGALYATYVGQGL